MISGPGFESGAWVGEGTAGNPKSLANSMNRAREKAQQAVGRDPAAQNRELATALDFAKQLLACAPLERTRDGVTHFEIVTAQNLVRQAN